MKILATALLLTSILQATPSKAVDYCQGFLTCTFDKDAIYFDLSNDLWARTRVITIRKAAEAYCADHPNSKVYIDLGGEGSLIEGTCGVQE